MNKRLILFISILILNIGFVFSQSTVSVSAADSAYNEKDFPLAIDIYNAVIREEGTSAELLYNLGNAYYQNGDYGMAMVSYLRAHKLNPYLKENNANIRYLQNKIEDANKSEIKGKRLKVTEDEPTFFQNIYTTVAINTSSNVWAVLGAIFFILFIICVALYIFTRNVIARKIGFFGGFTMLGFSLICVAGAFVGSKAYFSEEDGIIVSYKINLQTEPGKGKDKDSDAVLTRGTKVRIISEETDAQGNVSWYKIRLNSDYNGWIPSSSLIII